MQTFINLPVRDLAVAKRFYAALGFGFNEHFADANMEAVTISDSVSVLLLVEPYFQTFTRKRIADTATSAEAIFALAAGSRAQVDQLADRAVAAGGGSTGEPHDLGFLYRRDFADPDGHLWQVIHLDPAAVPAA